MTKITKAIFLDRDGTINKEVGYLHDSAKFFLIPGVIDAINIFHKLGYVVIVVTNQSGVARGYYSEKDVVKLHNYIDGQLQNSASRSCDNNFDENKTKSLESVSIIDAYYYCPHHPEGVIKGYAISCNCRKPNSGMIDRAVYDFKRKGIQIVLSKSIIIGDKEIDMQTGKNANIGRKILLRSGDKIDESNTIADMICDNLFEFAQVLILNEKRLF